MGRTKIMKIDQANYNPRNFSESSVQENESWKYLCSNNGRQCGTDMGITKRIQKTS